MDLLKFDLCDPNKYLLGNSDIKKLSTNDKT